MTGKAAYIMYFMTFGLPINACVLLSAVGFQHTISEYDQYTVYKVIVTEGDNA